MKKLILSVTLIGTLAITPTISCMAKVDSPNDNFRFKKTSIEEVSETSILVEDTITPKCKCNDKNCTEKEQDKGEKCKDKKEVCPSKVKEAEKIEKEKCPKENKEDKKDKKEN